MKMAIFLGLFTLFALTIADFINPPAQSDRGDNPSWTLNSIETISWILPVTAQNIPPDGEPARIALVIWPADGSNSGTILLGMFPISTCSFYGSYLYSQTMSLLQHSIGQLARAAKTFP